MLLYRASRVSVLCAFVLLLAGCESSEERAEKHFQSGMELLEAGDVDRAIVEFRNVFQLNRNHVDARLAFAGIQLQRGNLADAYRNYLFASEQSPDDIETRLILAEIAAQTRNWEEARRHYELIADADPDNPRIQTLATALEFGDAIQEDDLDRIRSAAQQAEVLVEQLPENIILRRILIEAYIRDQRISDALTQLDRAIEIEPDSRILYDIRLSVLAQLSDADGMEAHLLNMIERFPEDPNIEATLLRLYLGLGRADDAEDYLRTRAEAEDATDAEAVDLVGFIVRLRGADAGLAEVDKLLTENPGNLAFISLQASLLFDTGKPEEAQQLLERTIEGRESGPELSNAKLTLSGMLLSSGNEVGARRLVEEVLSVDPTNVEALKRSAIWLIDGDQPEQAIQALRTALDQAPEDAEIMTLLSRAHERNGSRQLAKEMLSLAVERSNNAPAESLRYSQVLLAEGNFRAAEDVLINSLRLNADNVGLLAALGQLYVGEDDWPRATQVVSTLRRLGTEEAVSSADALQVAVFAGQDRTDETIEFLEGLAEGDEQAIGARIAIARAHLVSGNNEAAISSIETSIEESPDSLTLQFAAGAIYAATGDFGSAEAKYRGILDVQPNAERVWIELMRVLITQGQRDEALSALSEGLEAMPGAPNLLWARASVLEQDGDYEGAIEVYEQLYAENTGAVVVANNLASLISTYRTDEESLERAYAVARRLRGIEVPAFQDTYGWIAYRRGDLEEAIEHLEPAAAGLPGDALVQYHLAKTYLALERRDEALAQFRKAVEVAGNSDLRPQIAEARQQIINLEEAVASE